MRDLKVDYLRNVFHKYPCLYSHLSHLYQEVIRPFVTGYTTFWVYYILFIKKKEIAHLRDLGFEKITIFKPRTWRYGKSLDRAFRRYYIADLNGHRCFVKIAKGDKTVENEVFVQKKLGSKSMPYTPKCLLTMENFAPSTHLLAIEFIEGLEVITKSDMNKKWFKDQSLEILKQLENMKLVHADIHPGNLMKSGGRLFIMDFGISKFVDCDNKVNYVERPGTYFKRQGNYRIYDDAYSLLLMISKAGCDSDQLFLEKIKTRIGRISILIDTNGK